MTFSGAPQHDGYGPQYGNCPEEGEFGWAHETACDQYYKCTNGTFSHEQCPNGLVFDDKNPVYDFCTFYWKVDCGEKTIGEFQLPSFLLLKLCQLNVLKIIWNFIRLNM